MDWLGCSLLAGAVASLALHYESNSIDPDQFCPAIDLFHLENPESGAPFINPGLFQNVRYTLGLVIAFGATGIGYSLVFLTPTLLTQVHQLRLGLTGYVMVPANRYCITEQNRRQDGGP